MRWVGHVAGMRRIVTRTGINREDLQDRAYLKDCSLCRKREVLFHVVRMYRNTLHLITEPREISRKYS
jgi:hypothetical protein